LPPSNLYSGPDFDINGVTPSPLDVPSGSYTALEAPLPNYGTINGTLFADTNGDGTQGLGESGIEGVVVKVFDSSNSGTPVCTITTNGNGAYSCSDLPLNKDYVVKPSSPYDGSEFTGEDVSDKVTGVSNPYTLTPSNTLATYNVGVVVNGGIQGTLNAGTSSTPTGSISGTVWLDQNNDGVKGSGDTGMVGVTVHLGNSGDVKQTTSTDVQGSYSFTNITVGTYTVTVENPNPAYFSFVQTNSTDNNVNNYGAGEVDVTPESATKVNAVMQQNPSTKKDICTSNDRTSSGPCQYIGTTGLF